MTHFSTGPFQPIFISTWHKHRDRKTVMHRERQTMMHLMPFTPCCVGCCWSPIHSVKEPQILAITFKQSAACTASALYLHWPCSIISCSIFSCSICSCSISSWDKNFWTSQSIHCNFTCFLTLECQQRQWASNAQTIPVHLLPWNPTGGYSALQNIITLLHIKRSVQVNLPNQQGHKYVETWNDWMLSWNNHYFEMKILVASKHASHPVLKSAISRAGDHRTTDASSHNRCINREKYAGNIKSMQVISKAVTAAAVPSCKFQKITPWFQFNTYVNLLALRRVAREVNYRPAFPEMSLVLYHPHWHLHWSASPHLRHRHQLSQPVCPEGCCSGRDEPAQ